MTAKLLSKRHREAKYIDGIDPAMEYSVELTNKTRKDIRAFTGILRFDDLFEREIQKVNVTYEDGLKAGETRTWDIEVKYNQFMDSHERMASIDFADIKSDLYVEEVIFADGMKQSY